MASGAPPASLTSDRKLHFARLLDHFRGLQNFEANHATIIAEIGNNPGTNLITFLHARIAQRNGQRVGFLVVLSLHAPPSYFANFDVLQSVTTVSCVSVSSTTTRNSISVSRIASKYRRMKIRRRDCPGTMESGRVMVRSTSFACTSRLAAFFRA